MADLFSSKALTTRELFRNTQVLEAIFMVNLA
jgi:hypothetical protein